MTEENVVEKEESESSQDLTPSEENIYEKILSDIYKDIAEKEEHAKQMTEADVRKIAEEVASKLIKQWVSGVQSGKYPFPGKYPYPPKKEDEPDLDSILKEMRTKLESGLQEGLKEHFQTELQKSMGQKYDDIDRRLIELAESLQKTTEEVEVIKNQPAEIITKSLDSSPSGFESIGKIQRDGSLERK